MGARPDRDGVRVLNFKSECAHEVAAAAAGFSAELYRISS